ncbi:MAG: ABC transporter permease [Clostridia bacterium]|nr:ABC transporter permease [Clostridia bacterium]
MTNDKNVREPLFQISKRDGLVWYKAWFIRAVAVLGALLLSSLLVIFIVGENPIKIWGSIFKGSFATKTKFWIMFEDLAILLAIAIAVTPAFKMKFWNIGAEGQVLVGCLAAASCSFYLGDKMAPVLLIILMVVSSILAGAIWAVLPAIFKAKWNTNETLFTLMMNYIATYLVLFFLNVWVKSGSGVLGILPHGQFPKILNNEYLLPIVVILFVTGLMFVYLKYSKQGYEISLVGESINTAKYAGVNVGKVIIRTLIISGAICGLTGGLLVGAINHTLTDSLAGGRGFTAILVSWLAKFNPLYMILTAFTVVFFQKGANQLATDFSGVITESFGEIIVGIIFLFIIGCEFFISYKLTIRKRAQVKEVAEQPKVDVQEPEEEIIDLRKTDAKEGK